MHRILNLKIFRLKYLENDKRFLKTVKRLIKQLFELYNISKDNFLVYNPFNFCCFMLFCPQKSWKFGIKTPGKSQKKSLKILESPGI